LVPVPLNKNETEIGYAGLEPRFVTKNGFSNFLNPNQTGTKILVFKESRLGLWIFQRTQLKTGFQVPFSYKMKLKLELL
jgi:hypothetical protein